jgi:L-seryl-tRNA(Ser) seleniumtransferase
MDSPARQRLRALPSIDEILRSDAVRPLLDTHPRWAVTEAARRAVASERARILGQTEAAEEETLDAVVRRELARLVRPAVRRVVNATGVLLHTNLGRAPLARRALDRIADVAGRYCNLEYDLEARGRGSRHAHLAGILTQLTGAEDAVVANNNAAAVLLVASALAAGKEVVVSRGELVEIGGSFRVPEVVAAGGARLREVGTTNRTRIADYRAVVGPETGMLLKVHRSNFAVVGFTEEATREELVTLGRETGLPVVEDLGSGAFVPLGHPPEPTPAECLAAGVDLVTWSGDKLLGGPQAGMVAGKHALVQKVRKHPLMRAMRPDKLTLLALEATLEIYRDGAADTEVPIVRHMTEPAETVRARAERLAAACRDVLGARATVLSCESIVKAGGGSLPLQDFQSWAAVVRMEGMDAASIEAKLRSADPPVVGRIAEDGLWLDARTIEEDEIALVAAALRTI